MRRISQMRQDSELADYVVCRHCRKAFRAIRALHLVRLHGYNSEHPVADYKRRFRLESASCREVRKRLSEIREEFWARQGRHWTGRILIAEIRRLFRSVPPKSVAVRTREAGRRLFGSWEAAVRAAGFDYEDATGIRHWTAERIVRIIRERAAAGKPLHSTAVKRQFPALHSAAIRHFPSNWAKALQAAGFDPRDHRMTSCRWDQMSAESWVRQQVAKRRSILARDVPVDLKNSVRRKLGANWSGFVESLGIPYPGVKKKLDWTKDEVLSEIRRWAREGHRMNYRKVKSEYQALIHQARKFFGSWDRARTRALR